MPRDSAGNYNLVAGNPVQSGEVVSSSWANNTLDDVAVALSDSLDRNGRGGMLAPFRFADGTNLLPGASWTNETTTGFYRFDGGDLRAAVLTQDVMRWQTSGAQVWDSKRSQWVGLLDAGGATTIDINQAGHGFAVLDCVQFEGTWVKALADDDSTLALGVVVEVIDTDNFTYAMSGRFEVANGLVSDSWYYLSDTVAGELTPTEPKISQPIVYVESNSHISVYPYRPFEADPYADLPTVGTNDQTLRWNDTLPGWEANSNLLVQADGLVSAGNTGGLVVGANTPVNTLVTTSAGNVGIGTNNPQARLDLGASVDIGVLHIFNDGSNRYGFGIAGGQMMQYAADGASLTFGQRTVSGDTFTERMRITPTGAVGIGTATPDSLLHLSLGGTTDQGEVAMAIGNDSVTARQARIVKNTSTPYELKIRSKADAGGNGVPITFETKLDGEAMRLDTSGNLLVGTQSGSDRLRVAGATTTSSLNALSVTDSTFAQLLQIRCDGYINTGLRTLSPYNFGISGRDAYIDSNGGFGYLSSARKTKMNISPLAEIEWLNSLTPVSFNYRKKTEDQLGYTDEPEDGIQYGLIAEDVEAVNPDLCFYGTPDDENEIAGVHYRMLIPVLVKAIQEQQAQIDELRGLLQ
jgi:hypothetical protein